MPGQNQINSTNLPMKALAAISKGDSLILGANEDEVTPSTAANQAGVIGFAQNDAAIGESVSVHIPGGGIAMAKSSAAIALGAFVQTSATAGAVATAAPGAGVNAHICGMALRAAGGAGELIPVIPLRFVLQG